MIYRFRLAALCAIFIAMPGISLAVPASPLQIPDPMLMDSVVESAFEEGKLAHSSIFLHRHRSRRPRSSLIIYFSNTPRYRTYYYDRPYYRSSGSSYRAAKKRCARKYRSYNWRTDKFTTYSGKKKLCPYVRPYY